MASSYTTDSSAYDDELVSATDTETESSLGDAEYNFDDIAHLSPEAQEHEIFWQYQYHKKRYRRFTRKPNRRARRQWRRYHHHKERKHSRGRGKGKGKGRRRRPARHLVHMINNLTDAEYEEIFFGGRGKGKGRGHKSR